MALQDPKSFLQNGMGGGSNEVKTESQAISLWADILEYVFEFVVPASTTVASAKSNFISNATGMSDSLTGVAIFLSAWNSSIVIIGNGMIGYTVTPPVYEFTDFKLDVSSSDADFASTQIGAKIVLKAQAGLAENNITHIIVNWS